MLLLTWRAGARCLPLPKPATPAAGASASCTLYRRWSTRGVTLSTESVVADAPGQPVVARYRLSSPFKLSSEAVLCIPPSLRLFPGRHCSCHTAATVRVCVPFQLRVSVAVLLELTEPAKPVERPCLCCNPQGSGTHSQTLERLRRAHASVTWLTTFRHSNYEHLSLIHI